MLKTIHKFVRKLKSDEQIQLCNGKTAIFAENSSYFWAHVSCKKCLKMKPKGK